MVLMHTSCELPLHFLNYYLSSHRYISLLLSVIHHHPLCSRAACHWQVADLPGKRVVVLFGEMRGPPSGPAQSAALWLWEGTVSREALAG